MHLQCTMKLLNFLKPEITEKNTDDDFFAWHGHYLAMDRKKFLILMNDLTRFCVVLYGVQKKHFQNPVDLFKRAIFIAMDSQGYQRPLIQRYIDEINEVTYGKSKNRQLISRLNRAVFSAWVYAEDGLYFDVLEQPQISVRMNREPVGQDQWKIVSFPDQKMDEYLHLLE